jgi:thiamine pyrophosphokinase
LNAGADSASSFVDTIIVVPGGDPVHLDVVDELPRGALVVAADSGIERAVAVGLHVDIAVGDFDSVSDAALAAVIDAGALVERHPHAKEHTDLELALASACGRHPRRVLVLGGHGGRLDHFLANALLLASPRWGAVDIVARMGSATLTVVHHESQLRGEPGDLVTLVAVHGVARGVRTAGLLYPLDGDDLEPGATRGVSNELAGQFATVSLTAGTLLAIQPGQRGTHLDKRSQP